MSGYYQDDYNYDYLQGQAADVQQQITALTQQSSTSTTLPAGSAGQIYIADASGNPTPGNVSGDSNGLGLTVVGDTLTATLTQDLRTTASPTFEAVNITDLAAQLAVLGIPKSKYNGTAAPTTGDDTGDGYSVGSVWVDTTADDGYMCMDATLGAAVWKKITP